MTETSDHLDDSYSMNNVGKEDAVCPHGNYAAIVRNRRTDFIHVL